MGFDTALPDQPSLIGTVDQSVQWFRAHDPAECQVACDPERQDCAQARCDHSTLNHTGNVLVLVRANELIAMDRVNTFLAIISVSYLAVNVVCMLLNSYNNDCKPEAAGCSPATTPKLFHCLEFGATFIFNSVDVLALSYSPRTLSNQYQNPALLKLAVLFTVCLSLVSFLLVWINLEKFEILSHELEYLNELTITAFDAVLLISLLRGRHLAANSCSERCISLITLLAAGSVAAVQLGVYNLSGWTASGESKGERNAHYLEFSFGCITSAITFWFTMDNKMCAGKRLRELMYRSEPLTLL